MPTPVRYALWSMLIIAPTMIIMPALATTLAELREPLGADTGPMAAAIAIMALTMSAVIAPAIVLPASSGSPIWSGALAAGGILELLVLLFSGGAGTPEGLVAGAYVPGALVCLNLTALIALHAWVASVGMGFSPAVGIATGGAYSLWLLGASTAQELGAFHGISAVGLILAFTAATVAAFVGSAYAQTASASGAHGSA